LNAGHSERRTLFGETSEFVAQKTRAAIDAGLSVILCIGETLEEREAGKCTQVIETQLQAVVQVTKEADWRCASVIGKRELISDTHAILQQDCDCIRTRVGHRYRKSRDDCSSPRGA